MSMDRRHNVVRGVAAILAVAVSLIVPRLATAANWTPAGVAFTTASGNASNLRMVSDGRRGFIAAWIDARNTPAEIYCQRVDSTGVAQWSSNGVLVSAGSAGISSLTAAPDGRDGVVLAWTADRASATRYVFTQRLDSSGVAQWTANGMKVDATTANVTQLNPTVCPDGAGGAIVAWVDGRAGNADVFVQRIAADSSRLWTAGGITVAASSSAEGAPRLLDDGVNGAFITWETAAIGGAVTRAQHLRANGVTGYPTTYLPATALSESAVMTRLAAGTLALAWSVSTTNQLHAAALDTSGAASALTTLLVSSSSKPFGLLPQSTGGALLAYADGARIDILRLDAAGRPLGGAAALITAQTMGTSPSLAFVGDGADGAFAVWPSQSRVYIRHVLATGASDWNGRIALASGVASVQSGAVAVGDVDALVAWIDDRNTATSGDDLFAQRVSNTGVTGSYFRILTSIASGTGIILPKVGRIHAPAGSDLAILSEGTLGQYVDHIVVGTTTFAAVPNYTFHAINGDSTFTVTCSGAPIVSTVAAVAGSYRAFSVPAVFANNTPASVFANLMPYDVTRWRLGHWVATDSAYAEPGGALTQIVPGEGYWFVGLNDTTLTFSGGPTPQTLFTLPMPGRGAAGTGWTQFGSPFRFPLAVSQLRLSLGPDVPIGDPANTRSDHQVFEWDPTSASYVTANILLPGHVYWLWRQSAQAISLRFPFDWDPVALNAGVPAVPMGADWALAVRASAGARVASLEFGAAPVAAHAWNGLSSRAIPSPVADALSLVARVTGWGSDDGDYRTVFGPDGDALAWDFEASAGERLTEASFTFDGLPAGRNVRLSEPAAGWSREVSANEPVTLVLSSVPRRLRLEVTRTAGSPAHPALATAVRAVGPNPFRERVALALVLGQDGPLRWDIFDLAGRRLRTETRRLGAGEHTLVWDGLTDAGRRATPGLYLVRWQAAGASGTVRLVRVE